MHALAALTNCFAFDAEGFLSKERFDKILDPLMAQLDVTNTVNAIRTECCGGSAVLRNHCVDLVVPCVGALSAACGGNGNRGADREKTDSMWKKLHHQAILLGRSDAPLSRWLALNVVSQCYERVGEELLILVPETLPFLAELMEDDNSEVEELCHRVIKEIEDLSGEKLDEYLN